jgi:large subunit ribosomal protein L35
MNKPVYRHLARRKWESFRRKLVMQRIEQMHVVPDVLPRVDPVVDVDLWFRGRNAPPGDFVLSTLSENIPHMRIQPYDQGEQLVTIAIVDPDVPNVDKDDFDQQCHFLASNIKISVTNPFIRFEELDTKSQILFPWLPPYAQKGSPYHRLAIFVLAQKDNAPLDLEHVRTKIGERLGFVLRAHVDRHFLKPIGVGLFRSQWDEGTEGVMQRAGIEGADIQFKRKRIEPLPYYRRAGSRYR